MLSRSCKYGLQAALYLAAQERDGYVPIRQISDDLGLSHPFLTKVLQQLTRQGLMRSWRGPHGGVKLAQPTETLTLGAIVEAIDGLARFEGCVLGRTGCGTDNPCLLHQQWQPARHEILTTFLQTSLLDLAATARALGSAASGFDLFLI